MCEKATGGGSEAFTAPHYWNWNNTFWDLYGTEYDLSQIYVCCEIAGVTLALTAFKFSFYSVEFNQSRMSNRSVNSTAQNLLLCILRLAGMAARPSVQDTIVAVSMCMCVCGSERESLTW